MLQSPNVEEEKPAEEKRVGRTMATQYRSGVASNANVLQAPRSKQGCGSAELPQKFRDQSATPHAPIDESAPALEISSYFCPHTTHQHTLRGEGIKL